AVGDREPVPRELVHLDRSGSRAPALPEHDRSSTSPSFALAWASASCHLHPHAVGRSNPAYPRAPSPRAVVRPAPGRRRVDVGWWVVVSSTAGRGPDVSCRPLVGGGGGGGARGPPPPPRGGGPPRGRRPPNPQPPE